MNNKIYVVDPNVTDPDNPGIDQAPVDPSNTSNIGQRVEQGVISTKEGISEQSSEWEDSQERNIPKSSGISNKGENYLKNPSPEERNDSDR
ncbi:hypothetical protein [Segetibacter koreensis]|uniref:hypothetical protein n=1 Tax=Segetibacter koreensis TaxID=398037 RepID=UPI00035E41D2|nr:hypothetical protein [Segetibacter koreensis]